MMNRVEIPQVSTLLTFQLDLHIVIHSDERQKGMDWKVLIITYNIGMQKGTEAAVDALLADVLRHKPQVVAVGMQEVAHAETMGGAPLTWHRLMVDWMAAKAGMVLLTNTFQATNTIAVWIKRNLLGMVRVRGFEIDE